jgi:hypothetical protein
VWAEIDVMITRVFSLFVDQKIRRDGYYEGKLVLWEAKYLKTEKIKYEI